MNSHPFVMLFNHIQSCYISIMFPFFSLSFCKDSFLEMTHMILKKKCRNQRIITMTCINGQWGCDRGRCVRARESRKKLFLKGLWSTLLSKFKCFFLPSESKGSSENNYRYEKYPKFLKKNQKIKIQFKNMTLPKTLLKSMHTEIKII